MSVTSLIRIIAVYILGCLVHCFAFNRFLFGCKLSIHGVGTQVRYFPHTIRFATQPKASTDKIRVRLLSDVKGTGRKGEILFTSAAMWTNVLMPKKLAEKLSDDDVARLAEKKSSAASEELTRATTLAESIKSMPKLVIKRKVGPNQILFGAVTNKQLFELLKQAFPQYVISTSCIIITSIKCK